MVGPRYGLTLGVVRSVRGDFTLGGISGTHTYLTLVGHHVQGVTPPFHMPGMPQALEQVMPMPRDSRVFEVSDEKPPVAIYVRNMGAGGKIAHIVPVTWVEPTQVFVVETSWTMFGGNYAERGDSRVCDLLDDLLGHRFYGALAIHDRIER